MSLLLRSLRTKKILHVYKLLSTTQARHDHWTPDFAPGPYPKTKEEREAAAKKYNLLPEEYEPFPDDGDGFGDYPKLPYESVTERDPYYPWDDEELRRNFMDPVPYQIVTLLPEQHPTEVPGKVVFKELMLFNVIPVIIIFGIMYLLSKIHFHHGLKKQYPQPGVVHYTFELDYEKAKSS